jgi:cytochrome c
MQIEPVLPRYGLVALLAACLALVACFPSEQVKAGEATPRARTTPADASGVRQVALQLTPAPNAPGNAQNGRQLFTAKGCTGCHQIPSVPAKPSLTGPLLNNMALRPTIAGEQIQNTPENMAKWIQNPPALKPGTAMPALGLNDQEAQDLAAFVYAQPHNPVIR